MQNKIYHRKLAEKILKFIDDNEIIILHGARQTGKTTLLHYLINKYIITYTNPDNIIYMDLEDFDLIELCNSGVNNVIKYLQSKGCDFEKKIFLIIDEIQYLDNPSSFLKLFYDKYKGKVKLIVSGSSSFEIKSKFKDSLVGRTINFELFGLDFDEFLWFNEKKYNITVNDIPEIINTELQELFIEFLKYGTYPGIVLEKDIYKKEIKLKQIINTYIKKDIRDIGKIKNINKFNNLIRLLAQQAGGLLNITELSNTSGLSKQTIYDYLFLLENTYIIKLIYPFHKNIRSELSKMPKIYFEDTGILNILLNKSFSNTVTGQMLENTIYTILRKNKDIENINYWRTNKNQEIDFIITERNKILPIEVKTSFLNKYTTSIKYFKEKYSLNKGTIITLNKKETSKYNWLDIIYPWEIFKQL